MGLRPYEGPAAPLLANPKHWPAPCRCDHPIVYRDGNGGQGGCLLCGRNGHHPPERNGTAPTNGRAVQAPARTAGL